jgi:demethylmenaquinone methyltransferase/2-methoxy-6-polyprenyl-1,4-benzoquinol methylase
MAQETKEQRVHHVFEKIYDRYDFMNSVISFRRHRAWRRSVMKKMQVQPGDSALDVCCGTGDWSFSLAKAVGPKGRVTGLDFSKNML